MDNIVASLTSLEGRIGRQTWWIGVIILIVINIVISFLILPLIGLNMMPNFAALMADPNNVDSAAISNSITGTMRTAGWIGLVMSLIFAYPYAALGVKRRHDKDASGIDVWIFIALLLLNNLVQALGLFMGTVEVQPGLAIPTPALPATILNLIIFVYAIYLLVVLGFLRGTPGPNQYGPDPLGATVAAV